MKKWILIGLSCLAAALFSPVWASGDDNQAARQLIENWFAAMKANDTTKAATYLAPQFVSIHTDGIVRNKEQEINLMKNLHMKSYSLSDFKFSQSNNTLVVTYKDNGVEKIDNATIGKGAAGRMAVLQKKNDEWIIIAYANLDKV